MGVNALKIIGWKLGKEFNVGISVEILEGIQEKRENHREKSLKDFRNEL